MIVVVVVFRSGNDLKIRVDYLVLKFNKRAILSHSIVSGFSQGCNN